MSKKRNLKTALVMSLFLLAIVSTAGAKIIYVDADASMIGDGADWGTAHKYLQDALAAATGGDEIWVAQGTYKPDQGAGSSGSGVRTATFQLINNVAIKGGYAGDGAPVPDARDVDLYKSILSGDLSGNDIEVTDPSELPDEPTRAENSYHLVTGSGTDETAVLDGFTITAGYNSWVGADNDGGGMYNNNGSPTVTNCTFSGNSAVSGGGMYNYDNSSPTVTNCTFSENSATFGGGMYNSGLSSTPTLTNCTFSGNSATEQGGGMRNSNHSSPKLVNCNITNNSSGGSGGGMCNYNNSSPTVTNCTFSGNSVINGSGGGMYNYNSSPTVTNCTFSDNLAVYAGGMSNSGGNPTLTNCTFSGNSASGSNWSSGGGMCNFGGNPTLTNCTFSGNSANDRGGGMYNSGGSPIVSNCILWGNTTSSGGNEICNNSSTPVISYCDIAGSGGSGAGWDTSLGTDSGGNIDADPLFIDPNGLDGIPGTADDDLHLQAGSPCIDAGDNTAVPPDTTDLDDDGDTAEPIPFDLDGNPRILNGIVDMGAYEYQLPPIFVNASANGANDGSTWADAYNYLQDALTAAAGVGTIWIAEGTYTPDPTGLAEPREATFQLASGVAIYGGFPSGGGVWEDRNPNAYETILSGDLNGNDVQVSDPCDLRTEPTRGENSYHVITGSGTDATAVLDGFAIKSGNANASGNYYGGGMYNDSGSPAISNCTFSGNSALDGGGMQNYSESSPTVTNCTFSGNSAERYGGGMSNWWSSPILTNCTFSGNLAHNSGGGLDNYNYSSPTLTSCILWGNTAVNSDNQIYNDASTPVISYCDITGCLPGGAWDTFLGSDGGGNIDADPLFVDADGADNTPGTEDDNLRLSAGSPCIDAGDNTAVPAGVTTDLDGNPRFMDDPETADTGNGTAPIVDMGAYEFPNTPTGTDVTVQPLDPFTWERPVIVAFAEVTAPGVTSLTTSSSGPEPPTGSMAGDPETYYDITTTATYNGDIGVSIDYSGTSYTNESSLRLMHYVDTDSDGTADAWEDATTSLDTGANMICGTVRFLSLFAIFEPEENQPPVIDAIIAPLEPVQVNTTVTAGAAFSDPDIGDTHTAIWDWGDGSTSDGIVDEINGIVYGSHNYTIPGVYTVTLTLTDAAGASDQAVFQYVVVYDPGAGFVTGGGWVYSPAGALLDSAAEGKASFGFVAKYKKGATVPTGNTEFRFRAGGFRFKSSSYEWLVVAGTKAMFKGEGSIDGMDGSFKFMLTGVDDTEDKFRIKISDPAGEDPIYDNKRGEGDDAEPTTIGGGSIVIHGG